MMKKLVLLIVAALLLCGCTDKPTSSDETEMSDAMKFKEEYEVHNGEFDDDRGHNYIEVEISEKNPVVYMTMEELFDLMEEGKSAIVYFGFPECPWCRTLLPSLLSALNVGGIERLYYVNNYAERDLKELKDGEIVTTQQGSDDYYKLLEIMGDYAPVYAGLNDDSIKHMYYPTVLFIKGGEIIASHVGTVDSQKDVWAGITEEQRKELEAELMEKLNQVYMGACSIEEEQGC